MKQSKLRRRRVIRFAIMYFFMLFLFIILIVGPIIASRFLTSLPALPDHLIQPTGLNNNDTTNSATGTAEAGAAATAAATSAAAAVRRAFVEFSY